MNLYYYLALIFIATFMQTICAKVTILVLGCHLTDIQNDRVKSAIHYIENGGVDIDTEITWFLSGGVKNAFDTSSESDTEASKMRRLFNTKDNWSYEIDTKAKNTSENFAYFRKYLDNMPNEQKENNKTINFSENDIRPDNLMDMERVNMLKDIGRLLQKRDEFVEINCPACESTKRTKSFIKYGFDYHQCDKCETLYVSPRPNESLLDWFYTDSYLYKYC